MQIIPLSEGEFTVGPNKKFIPFNSITDDIGLREAGSLVVEVQPFLIITDTDYILLDTGLGIEIDNELQIHNNLRANGVEPEQITKVILSHLHKDHAGGIFYVTEFGELQLSFPQAMHYIYKAELDYALSLETKSYVKENFYLLQNNAQVQLYNEAEGEIAKGITHAHSGGHCKEHQTIKITDGEQTVFYAGDEASQLKQLKSRFIAKYDFDGRKAADLRTQFATDGAANNWDFLFYHDINTPVARL